MMSIENPIYVNELVVTFEGDDQNNVSWKVRADETVTKSLHASFDELARVDTPLSVMGIRALYEILCENMVVLALERGNRYQFMEHIREMSEQNLPKVEGSESTVDGDIAEGVVIH